MDLPTVDLFALLLLPPILRADARAIKQDPFARPRPRVRHRRSADKKDPAFFAGRDLFEAGDLTDGVGGGSAGGGGDRRGGVLGRREQEGRIVFGLVRGEVLFGVAQTRGIEDRFGQGGFRFVRI